LRRKILAVCLLWVALFSVAALVYKFRLWERGGSATDGQERPSVDQPIVTPIPSPMSNEPQRMSPTARTPIDVPYITWGGDVATFYANGGLETKPESIFGRLGLKLKLVAGDDFDAQVQKFKARMSPFLRGTLSMLGQKSEIINGHDPAVVFLQLTWSSGDHMVARQHLKTLADLAGKKVGLQRSGPHVGMLRDILWTAGLKFDQVHVIWTDALTGDKGPARLFREDSSIDACFVISPDMTALTGGLDARGNGTNGTVAGAHVLVSTSQMSRSIADVYACESGFYKEHRDLVDRFAAGYLKGCEELLELKRAYSSTGRSPGYESILQLTQSIFGTTTIPKLEDADGLISDCAFVGLAGNRSFFADTDNPSGFNVRQADALDLAIQIEHANKRIPFLPPADDFDALKKLGNLLVAVNALPPAPPPLTKIGETIFSFKINFGADQDDFDEATYGDYFRRVIVQASLFGRAGVFIRGHADPTRVLYQFVKAGEEKGLMRRVGSQRPYQYYWQQELIDWNDTKHVIDLIRHSDLGSGDNNPTNPDDPKNFLRATQSLSTTRAESVRRALIHYATSHNLRVAENQFVAVGVGIQEPIVPKPENEEDAQKNRRVEFRISKLGIEATNSNEFQF
jgi:hypothetical protein